MGELGFCSGPPEILFETGRQGSRRLIAYIAARPPADRIKRLAHLYGKKVVYLPIGQFSPSTLKKLRIFHILDGRHVRAWAGEYIY